MCAMHGAAAALNDSNPDSIRSQVAVAVRAACRPGLFPASACVAQPHTPIVQAFEYRSCPARGCMGDFVAGAIQAGRLAVDVCVTGGVKAYVMYHGIGGVFLC